MPPLLLQINGHLYLALRLSKPGFLLQHPFLCPHIASASQAPKGLCRDLHCYCALGIVNSVCLLGGLWLP